jgi:uncharacterized surface protein with fasciclin (FAS1) repeats
MMHATSDSPLSRLRALLSLTCLAALLTFGLAACASETTETETETETMEDSGEMEQAADTTVVDIAMSDERFSTLVTAVDTAGLVETLSGEGPFTVFAPTNEAFGALPEGTVSDLLQPENRDRLTTILQYHVVSGATMSSDLEDGMEVETLAGETLTVSIEEGTVMVGEATVLTPDVEASNGVVHVIDTVLMPPEDM